METPAWIRSSSLTRARSLVRFRPAKAPNANDANSISERGHLPWLKGSMLRRPRIQSGQPLLVRTPSTENATAVTSDKRARDTEHSWNVGKSHRLKSSLGETNSEVDSPPCPGLNWCEPESCSHCVQQINIRSTASFFARANSQKELSGRASTLKIYVPQATSRKV